MESGDKRPNGVLAVVVNDGAAKDGKEQECTGLAAAKRRALGLLHQTVLDSGTADSASTQKNAGKNKKKRDQKKKAKATKAAEVAAEVAAALAAGTGPAADAVDASAAAQTGRCSVFQAHPTDLTLLVSDLAPLIASSLEPHDLCLSMQCSRQWCVAWKAQLSLTLSSELALVGSTQSLPRLVRMYQCCWPSEGITCRQRTCYMPTQTEWGAPFRSKPPLSLRFEQLQLVVQLFECRPQSEEVAECQGDYESRSDGQFLCSIVVPVVDSAEDGVAPAVFSVVVPGSLVRCTRDELSLIHAQLYVLDCARDSCAVALLSESCESQWGQQELSSPYGSRDLCELVTIAEGTRDRNSKYSIYALETPLKEKRLMEIGWVAACGGKLASAARGVECNVDIWADFKNEDHFVLERIDFGFFSDGPQGVTPYPLTRYEFLQNLEELDWNSV